MIHIDFETRSTVDLKKTGVYPYMAHESTDVWCAAYCVDDGPVKHWVPGDPVPEDILAHKDGEFFAHNAAFERQVFKYIMGPRYGWPVPDVSQWRCTMVMAYAAGLPGALGDAAPAAGLDMRKDTVGARVMMQMCRPRTVSPEGVPTWWDDKSKLDTLIAYCKQDVEVERQLHKRLRPLSDSEQKLWQLDQIVNDRGVLVDEDMARAALKIVDAAQKALDLRMKVATNYEVSKCSNRNEILRWVRSQGVECDKLNKAALEELLSEDDPLPPHVRNVLEIRKEASLASVAKIDTLLNGMSPEDGRAKGLLQFHAASTGRWGGRRFQPQNLRRPEEHDIDLLIDVVSTGNYAYLADMFDKPLSAVADTLRGMLRASPGHRIVAADYSNIEGRVLAWLAGEGWKLDAFRAFDRGDGHDLYKLTAGGILGKKPEDISKDERQAYGKVPELALGYQGGVGAFNSMAANYGVDLEVEQIEFIRDSWREQHPATKQFWYDMEEAAVCAVDQPGSIQRVGKLAFKVSGSWLFLRLPSGRLLAYPYPKVMQFDTPWGDVKSGLTYFSTIDVSKKKKIVDDPQNTGKWARIKTYGGMLAENATQAVARDILADAMPRLEPAGYPIILTVHDEIVCEVPNGHGSVTEMEKIMCDLPAWAKGLPQSAEGFEGERYRK